MNILKINGGKVWNRKDNGSLVRTIGGGDAISADFNGDQSLVVITTVKGKVEIRKENGSLVRTIGNGDATNAKLVWQRNCGDNKQRENGTQEW